MSIKINKNILKSTEFNFDCKYTNEKDKVKINIYNNKLDIINVTIHDTNDLTIKYHNEILLKSKIEFNNRTQVLENVLLEYIGNILLENYYYPICTKLNIKLNFDNELSDYEKIIDIQKLIKKDNINYWHMQIADTKEESIELLNKHLIPYGCWNEKSTSLNEFKENMKVGDIVLIKYKTTVIALVEIVSDIKNIQNEQIPFDYQRNIKIIKNFENINNFPQPLGRLMISNDKDTLAFEYIDNLYNNYYT